MIRSVRGRSRDSCPVDVGASLTKEARGRAKGNQEGPPEARAHSKHGMIKNIYSFCSWSTNPSRHPLILFLFFPFFLAFAIKLKSVI